MQLQKKIVITRIGAQDGGFAFSPDGNYFYNIESPIRSTCTQLTVYRTADYEVEQILFKENMAFLGILREMMFRISAK